MNLLKNKHINVATLAFSKAFDTITHEKLLYTLTKYHKSGSTLL